MMGKAATAALGSTAAAAPRSPHPATAHAHDAGSPSVAVVPPPAAHAPDAGAPSVAITPPPPAPDVAVATPSPPQAHPPFPAFAFAPDLRAALPLQDAQVQRRPPKAPPKKRRSPVVPVVGSPGINAMLSQTSPKTIGVKRLSPKHYEIPCNSHRSKRRKLKSDVWNDFVPIYDDADKLREAECKHCKKVFVATRVVGTSSCSRHLLVCEERAKINEFVDSLKSGMTQPDLKKWQYDPDRAHLELVRMIVLHELPFRIVEYEGFRAFVRSLNPTFEFVSRSTIRIHCVDLFNEQKTMLRESLQELNSRVSLTADMWTSNQVVSYMVITCHYVDEKWRLRKKVIWFSEADTPRDGANLFNIMLECMQDWGLQKKIFSIALDNASNNNLCVSYMKSNLLGKELLPCKGELLHVRCAAHVINLIAQEGLMISCKAVDNIRESIKYVKSSPPRKKKFKEMIAQEGISCKTNLSLDSATRWNSTHSMVKTALEYRRAFTALKLQDTSYTCLPSVDEWETAEAVCGLLKVFLDGTRLVSGTLYPTAHLYFHAIWKIRLTLESESKHEDDVIKSMVIVMQQKLMKYWKLSFLNICLPVILDPRYKFKFLDFCLKSGLESEATKCLNKVKRTFKDLFVEYSSHDCDSEMNNDQGSSSVVIGTSNPWDQWDVQVKEHNQKRAKLSELDIYLKEDLCPQGGGFDILNWWSVNENKYPIISRIAKDVLAVPASTVASESAFSTGGRVLSDYRSRLVGSTVEALICLQDWMRPRGTTHVNTITTDVIYGTRADIYGRDADIVGP